MLLGLLAPALYSLQFYAERLAHRWHMWYHEAHADKTTLLLDSATLKWTKKNRELIVNNAYFDVIAITYANGKVRVTGVFDHEETEMHEAYAAEQQKRQGKKHTTRQIAQWLQTGWMPAQLPDLKPPPYRQSNIYNRFIPVFPPQITLPVPLPPPWPLS